MGTNTTDSELATNRRTRNGAPDNKAALPPPKKQVQQIQDSSGKSDQPGKFFNPFGKGPAPGPGLRWQT